MNLVKCLTGLQGPFRADDACFGAVQEHFLLIRVISVISINLR